MTAPTDDSPYTLDIPPFLRRKVDAYLNLPISDWPIIPVPSKYAGFAAGVPETSPPPITTVNRRPLRGAERDRFALTLAAVVKNGPVTFQALRKAFPKNDERTIRSALRRAIALHLVERDGRRYRKAV